MAEQPSWQEVLDLIAQLNESEYESASVQVGDVSIRLSKNDVGFDTPTSSATQPPIAAGRGGAQPRIETGFDTPTGSAATLPASAALGDTIDAPMIGVFYRRPSPGAEPFVEPGQRVEPDTTIGIIEIMKLMNPITAGKSGIVTEFLVTDAEAVEFGQALATIDTSA